MGRKGTGVTIVSDSSYEIAFTYKGKRCRERVKAKPCPANTRKLIQFRAAVLHAIEKGEFDYAKTFPDSVHAASLADRPGDVQTVEDYFDKWLKRKNAEIKASTYKGYELIVNRWVIPKFGKLALTELKRALIRDWLASIDAHKEKKVSNKRLSNIQSCMRSALQDAADDELIDANPLAGYTYARAERPTDGQNDDEIDPLSPTEQAAVLAKLSDGHRNMVQFALWTGVRTSELIALNWSDIDFIGGYVRVRRALTREAKGVAEFPKTAAGRRDIRLLSPAAEALKAQKPLTFLTEDDGPIFKTRAGEQFTGSHQIWRIWQAALKRAGVRYRNPYQTRHTYASMMLSAGEHPMWVAKQMGHADWTMIARVYGRWMPSADAEAGSRAVEKFAGEAGKFAGKSSTKLAKIS
ncbi:tyrosine-type recombinase/integrase [Ralstonia solanacearum species complex bacterium KE101]|uniref:site-specific integrase n=1 Tax=Ralstonia solanacearum species complex bacterium KE101 TaxID=3119587 RepID=UPI001432D194|nr:site-specific integrase [Ralstonia solanacearum]NKA55675.1 site-specific integrase [Ralstonia solanacearum]NKA68197.1 site-specific integrase [Ralstonia solanacearum]NKA85912.1 site-specific integrase [Ralstonia solanacearum]NKF54249.1 site-specific integrase [Ralstonia solanacearum]